MTTASVRRRAVTAAHAVLVAIVVLYGAFLQCDAMVGMYGPITAPGWLASLAAHETAMREPLVPAAWVWHKVEHPYVGGDPINYLAYAREMRSFYQPHVREPVYLALTRAWLGLTGGADIAVSLASITGGVLLILGTYLFGRAVGTPWVGLAAAAALAVEGEAIAWSPEGWRDSTCSAGLVFTLWALVRLHQRRTGGWAIAAGVAAGIACLTRVTAFTWVLPAFAGLIWIAGREHRRIMTGRVALASLVTVVIVSPYLINCARAYGDPFYALNYHTRYYRAAAGATPDEKQSALGFAAEQFRQRPVLATDTALRGLVVYPFVIKWRGIDRWMPGLGRTFEILALAGLVVWLWQPLGRVLLVTLLGSLVPYMLTWRLGGGGEWRFTLHAYPFYLVAGTSAIALAWTALRHPSARWQALKAGAWARAAMVLLTSAALCGVIAYLLGHSAAFVTAESLRHGESVSVGGSDDDGVFFGRGWSERVGAPPVVARFAVVSDPVVYVPLPERRSYRMVVRMGPLPPEVAAPGRVQLWVAGRQIAEVDLVWDPGRVGSYPIEVPADLAGGGLTAVRFVAADPPRPLGPAAARYQGLSGDLPVAFRFWLVRVTPGDVR